MAELLERDLAIAELHEHLASAEAGDGRVVIIGGPPGIGKSAVLSTFLQQVKARIMVGVCDDLSIPQVLGSFEEIAHDDPLLQTAFETDVPTFRRALIQRLDRPTVMAIEDIHWADQATLDLLQYISRRLQKIPVLLIVTMRVGLALDHPTARLLGQIPSPIVTRIDLSELTLTGVTELAKHSGRDPSTLYALTDGNPFLVTELLATDSDVPPTIADSVSARVASLPPPAPAIASTLSVIPGEAEWELVESILEDSRVALADLELSGVIVSSPNGVAFRHELLRRAVEDRLTTDERRRANRKVLQFLLVEQVTSSRIAHHAAEAGDIDALLDHSIPAMAQASNAGAHTQALEHALRIVPYIERLSIREQAEFWQAISQEHWINENAAESLEAINRAVDLWEQLDDRVRLGSALNRSATIEWWLTGPERSAELLEQAISVLESVPPSAELADAYIAYAQELGLSSRFEEALAAVGKAIAHAKATDDETVRGKAYGAREILRMAVGDPAGGRADGDIAVDILRRRNAHDELSLDYSNRIAAAINGLYFDHIDDDLRVAHEHARDIDSAHYASRLAMHEGRLHLLRGRWEEAREASDTALDRIQNGLRRSTALSVRALLSARRGDPTAAESLEEAVDLVVHTDDIQRIGTTAAVLAEMIWLGQSEDIEFLERAYGLARRSGYLRFYSETTIWLRRLGQNAEHTGQAPEPHAPELDGDFIGAAAVWRKLGFPYEQALSLAFSGEAKAMRTSIEIVERLGATATRDRIHQMMRERGHRLGRRRDAATRANPAGLTRRQMEVLELVADELTNTEIAGRLFISPKTVDHHVSAILTKLGVSSRQEAAGLLSRLTANTQL